MITFIQNAIKTHLIYVSSSSSSSDGALEFIQSYIVTLR